MNFFKPGDQNVSAKTDVKLSGTYTFFVYCKLFQLK